MSAPTETEIEKFIREHEAQMATWPESARQTVDHMRLLAADSFGRYLQARCAIEAAHGLLTSLGNQPVPSLLAIREAIQILRPHCR